MYVWCLHSTICPLKHQEKGWKKGKKVKKMRVSIDYNEFRIRALYLRDMLASCDRVLDSGDYDTCSSVYLCYKYRRECFEKELDFLCRLVGAELRTIE